MILSVVLYGCVTFSHSRGRTKIEGVLEQPPEENIGPKRKEVTGSWRILRYD
jgi:hypothetical protein